MGSLAIPVSKKEDGKSMLSMEIVTYILRFKELSKTNPMNVNCKCASYHSSTNFKLKIYFRLRLLASFASSFLITVLLSGAAPQAGYAPPSTVYPPQVPAPHAYPPLGPPGYPPHPSEPPLYPPSGLPVQETAAQHEQLEGIFSKGSGMSRLLDKGQLFA